MRTLFISPSYRCNERCVFCPCSVEADAYSTLELDEALRAVDESVSATGVDMVLISGGEPTLWKGLGGFVSGLRERGLKWGMLSNSTLFSADGFVDKFIGVAGSDFELTTAFHSHVPEEHDLITGLKGSFEKSLRGVTNMIERGVSVTVKHVINNRTYRGLPDWARWVEERFPQEVPVVICNMDICGVAERNKEVTGVRFEDSRQYLEEALDVLGPRRVTRVFNTPLCCVDAYYWRFMQKYESEEQMTALMLPARDGEGGGLRLNVRGDGGARFEVCKRCALQGVCPGTWKRTIEVLGEESLKAFVSND